jgi:predicted Zn-dependent peptidase
MTLVISGAVPPELGRRLLGTLPPALQGSAAAPRAAMRRPLTNTDLVPNPALGLPSHPADVTTPELWMAWLLPPVRGTDTTTFEVLGGVVSRVLTNLVNDGSLPDVLSVEASTILSTLGGALTCRLVLRPSADAGSIQKRVGASVAALSSLNFPFAAGGTGAGLAYQSALRATVLPTALSMENVAQRTMVRARLLHDEAGASLSKVMDSLEAITQDIVSNLAYRYLREEQARAVLLVPSGARADAHPPLLSSRPPPSSDATDTTDGDESAADSSNEEDDASQVGDLLAVAHAPGVGAALTTRLPNGLTLIALRHPGLPFASMMLGFHADPQPGETLAAADAVLYARRHPSIQGALQRGLSQKIERDHDSYREGLSMFATKVGSAFDLLADEARSLSVRWPSKAFERWLESTALAIGTPAERANRAFSSALWGNHVYGLRLNREAAAKLTSDQIYAWLDRVRRPANGALVIVGDIDPREITQLAAERLGDWHGDPTPPPPPPPPPPAASAVPAASVSARGPDLSVLLTEDPPRQSADIRFGCLLPPVRDSKDAVAGGVFREMLDDELLRRLRLELGISYAPYVRVAFLRGGTFVLDGHLDVGQSELPRALKILRGWLGTKGPLPEAHTFEKARWRMARRSGLAYATNYALARGLFDTWNMGLPLASLDQFPHDLASLTPEDLTAALAACRASAVVSVIGRGPLPAAAGDQRRAGIGAAADAEGSGPSAPTGEQPLSSGSGRPCTGLPSECRGSSPGAR